MSLADGKQKQRQMLLWTAVGFYFVFNDHPRVAMDGNVYDYPRDVRLERGWGRLGVTSYKNECPSSRVLTQGDDIDSFHPPFTLGRIDG